MENLALRQQLLALNSASREPSLGLGGRIRLTLPYVLYFQSHPGRG